MVITWDLTIPQLSGDQKRRGYVYLPDSYDREPERRYPVMYFFDGHNVFFDQDATYGTSWGMNDYMEQSQKELILVGIECNREGNGRLEEYAPFPFDAPELGHVKSKGKQYMQWLIKELKPMIDGEFRTLPDRKNTLIAGSSMGGLMALYAVTAFNQVFQRAACLSPSIWVAPGKMLELIARSNIRRDTCIYLDYGAKEMFNHPANAESIFSTSHLLMTKRVDLTMRIVPGGTHCEASWARQVPIFMECLGV